MISALERLADCIRNRRKLLGMSQEMLAEKTGLSLSLIRRIERKAANPTLTNLEKIASVLGEDISDLFYRHTEQDTNKLRKQLILTELSQLSVNRLVLIRQLIESFQKKEEEEYLTTPLGKVPVKSKMKDNQSILTEQEEEQEYLPTTSCNIQVNWKLKDSPIISAQHDDDEYLHPNLDKTTVKSKIKDNQSISSTKS